MANVVDGINNWPCTLDGVVTETTITVTMDGDHGLNAVCSGAARNGTVQHAGIAYDVRLPGSFEGGTLIVTFRRR